MLQCPPADAPEHLFTALSGRGREQERITLFYDFFTSLTMQLVTKQTHGLHRKPETVKAYQER